MATATMPANHSCAACGRYIADWLDDNLHATFKTKERRRLATAFQPAATKDITHLLMMYLAEEKHYEATCDKLHGFVRFTGLEPTILMFSSGIPAVAEAIEAIDAALFDATGKMWGAVHEWIRRMLFQLFLDLLDVHRMHAGRIPFRDIWSEAARAKRAAAAPADNMAVCGPQYEEELQVIKVVEGASFLDSYLNADETQKKEWDELYQ